MKMTLKQTDENKLDRKVERCQVYHFWQVFQENLAKIPISHFGTSLFFHLYGGGVPKYGILILELNDKL